MYLICKEIIKLVASNKKRKGKKVKRKFKIHATC